MSNEFILTIDQGTSATKAILFDLNGKINKRFNTVHQQYYPNPGWVEHDPIEIYEKTLEAIVGVLKEAQVTQEQIKCISISNQRETALVWDKLTGKPIHNAVVWQCQRASEICNTMSHLGQDQVVKDKSGLVLSPYFSAAKVKWLLDNIPGAREKAEKDQLLFGTIDTWLIWNLTGKKAHVTDYSNASRTQLFNISTLQWDEELLALFTIPKSMLPEILFSDEIFGATAINTVFQSEIPIAGVLGDSHAALFGQNCFDKGMAKTTYGTGSSIMMNIGKAPLKSMKGLVTSVGWGTKRDGIEYVFEGNINCTGATIKWLIDDLELIPDANCVEEIAKSIEGTEGVYFVPAFVGLSAPYWNSDARATITGMSRGTKKAHIVRAAVESIAYQIKDVITLMEEESGILLKELRVDGGPTRNSFLMQFQADILNRKVVRNEIEELSAIGTAYMAGIAVGVWKDEEEIIKLREKDVVFTPEMEKDKVELLYLGWKEAIKRTL